MKMVKSCWLVVMLLLSTTVGLAQTDDVVVPDSIPLREVGKAVLLSTGDSIGSIMAPLDSLAISDAKALQTDTKTMEADSSSIIIDQSKVNPPKTKRDWNTWTPNPQRALWLALVIPGAGQIYNRKFWKLPIIYGGFMGCIYALTWNNTMYKDYSQAYLDLMDDDPATQSYNKFLHLGKVIHEDDENEFKQYQKLFKNRKDKYGRWPDMSFFVMLGVYAISVIDAYVDAELSVFDISKDLSLQVTPTTIHNPAGGGNLLQAQSLGISCTLNF